MTLVNLLVQYVDLYCFKEQIPQNIPRGFMVLFTINDPTTTLNGFQTLLSSLENILPSHHIFSLTVKDGGAANAQQYLVTRHNITGQNVSLKTISGFT